MSEVTAFAVDLLTTTSGTFTVLVNDERHLMLEFAAELITFRSAVPVVLCKIRIIFSSHFCSCSLLKIVTELGMKS